MIKSGYAFIQACLASAKKHSLFLLIVVIFAGFRLYNLGAESLWYDEVGSIDQATRSLPSLFFGFLQDPPLYPFLLRYWIKLFGLSEVSLRLPSVIISVLSVVLAFRIARLLFNKTVAFFTISLMTVSPLHIFYSQEARYYMLSFFLVLLSVYIFLILLRSDSKKHYYLLTIVNIANLYANPLSLIVILLESIIVLGSLKSPTVNKRLWVKTQIITLTFFSLWLFLILHNIHQDYEFFKIRLMQKPAVLEQNIILETFEAFTFGGHRYGGSDSYLAFDGKLSLHWLAILWLKSVFLFFLAYSLFVFFKKIKEKLIFSFIIFWLFLPLIIFLCLDKVYLPRYFLICLFPFYFLVAVGIYNAGSFKGSILATLICASFLLLHLYYIRVLKIDWRAVAAQVDKNINYQETIVVAPAKHLQMCGYYSQYGIRDNEAQGYKMDSLLRQTKQMVKGPICIEKDGRYLIGVNDTQQLRLLMESSPGIFAKIRGNNLWLVVARWTHPAQESEMREYFRQFWALDNKKEYEGISVSYFALTNENNK
jgi:4-amino-4-deoxy-L-arabinose transferase-like glycosyltransferase